MQQIEEIYLEDLHSKKEDGYAEEAFYSAVSIYKSEFFIHPKVKFHTRRVYNILDVLKDTGGIFNSVMGLLSVLVLPFSYLNFYIQAISTMFIARTRDKAVFKFPPIKGLDVHDDDCSLIERAKKLKNQNQKKKDEKDHLHIQHYLPYLSPIERVKISFNYVFSLLNKV